MPYDPQLNLDWRDQKVVKKDGLWFVEGRPGHTVSLAWHQTPSNIPGKAFIGLRVTGPAGSATPPHTHGGAAVSATVIRGRVLNQMVCADGSVVGPKVYEVGESWYEAPGCHHVRSENAGEGEVEFIATVVIDEDRVREKGVMAATVVIDAAVEEERAGK